MSMYHSPFFSPKASSAFPHSFFLTAYEVGGNIITMFQMRKQTQRENK